MIYYLLKVSIFQALFVLFYLTFIRNQTYFRVSRVYLLSGVILSLALPFLTLAQIGTTAINQEVSQLIYNDENPVFSWWTRSEPVLEREYSWVLPLKFSYIGGCLFLLLRFLINLVKLKTLNRNYELIEQSHEIRVFRTSLTQPFSFFNNVFVPEYLLGSDELKKILDHECAHVRQLHSYDRVLVDFIIIFLWINPFTHIAKKLLIEVHEFEADAAVVSRSKDKLNYQKAILSVAGRSSISGLVSFFNYSTLKRRINMMNIKKSNKRSLISLVILIPLIAVLSVIFSFNLKKSFIESVNEQTKGLGLAQLVKSNPIPSIFPIKSDSTRFRISSGFGMRMHPITKEYKHHFGIDIAAVMGTPVIATADGIVIKVDFQPNGYGHYVLLQHGEEYMTRYAQMNTCLVKVGDRVSQGDLVGQVGSSGMSTDPHLHYEIHKDGKPVDPAGYIKDFQQN